MSTFKNDAVNAIFSALMEYKVDFLDRRKPGQWKGIVLALAEAYPDDSRQIIATAFPKEKRKGRTGAAPKIERMRDKYERMKGQGRLAQKAGGCKDCPENNKVVHSAMSLEKPARRVVGGKEIEPKAEPEEAPWSTVEELLEAFEGSTEAMLAFAQAKGVKMPGNIKDQEKIANYILEHFKA